MYAVLSLLCNIYYNDSSAMMLAGDSYRRRGVKRQWGDRKQRFSGLLDATTKRPLYYLCYDFGTLSPVYSDTTQLDVELS